MSAVRDGQVYDVTAAMQASVVYPESPDLSAAQAADLEKECLYQLCKRFLI